MFKSRSRAQPNRVPLQLYHLLERPSSRRKRQLIEPLLVAFILGGLVTGGIVLRHRAGQPAASHSTHTDRGQAEQPPQDNRPMPVERPTVTPQGAALNNGRVTPPQ